MTISTALYDCQNDCSPVTGGAYVTPVAWPHTSVARHHEYEPVVEAGLSNDPFEKYMQSHTQSLSLLCPRAVSTGSIPRVGPVNVCRAATLLHTWEMLEARGDFTDGSKETCSGGVGGGHTHKKLITLPLHFSYVLTQSLPSSRLGRGS